MAENPFIRRLNEAEAARAEANRRAEREKAEQAARHALGARALKQAQKDRSGTPLETFFADDPASLQLMRHFAEAAAHTKHQNARTGYFGQGLIRPLWQGKVYLLGRAVVEHDAYDLNCRALLYCDDEKLRMTSEFKATPDANRVAIDYGVVPENIGLEPAYFVKHPPELDTNAYAARGDSYGFRNATLDAILGAHLGI